MHPEALSLTLLVFLPIRFFVVLAVPLHLVFNLLPSIVDLLVNLVALAVLGKNTVATTPVAPLRLRLGDRHGVIIGVSYLEH